MLLTLLKGKFHILLEQRHTQGYPAEGYYPSTNSFPPPPGGGQQQYSPLPNTQEYPPPPGAGQQADPYAYQQEAYPPPPGAQAPYGQEPYPAPPGGVGAQRRADENVSDTNSIPSRTSTTSRAAMRYTPEGGSLVSHPISI